MAGFPTKFAGIVAGVALQVYPELAVGTVPVLPVNITFAPGQTDAAEAVIVNGIVLVVNTCKVAILVQEPAEPVCVNAAV